MMDPTVKPWGDGGGWICEISPPATRHGRAVVSIKPKANAGVRGGNIRTRQEKEIPMLARKNANPKEAKLDAGILHRIETFYAGKRMLASESDEPVSARRVVWRLLQEAVQTERAIRRPGPAAPRTAMPAVVHTAGEIFATEVEMAKDEIAYAPRIFETPSAAALTRYTEVMGWLRYIRGRNVARSRRAVLLLAAGVPEARVMDIFGFRSRQAVDGVRYRAISGILERLKRDLPADAID